MDSRPNYEEELTGALYKSLQAAHGNPDFGLNEDPELKTRERILGVEQKENNWLLHIGSDGLNLDHKMGLERQILADLGDEFPSEPFTVNFRRTRAQTKSTIPRGPQAPTEGPAAYGLKQRKKTIPGVKKIIIVASGKGGVGKSTVSTNLAMTFRQLGFKTGLLDADVYGPSSPTMLGLKGPMPVNEQGQLVPLEAHGVKTVSFGFLSDSYHPVVWRGPLVSKAIGQFCFEVDWGDLDLLVVDLPPGTGDVQLSLIETLAIDGALIVSTPQEVALIDAHKALSMFRNLSVRVLGLVENMNAYSCPNCGHKDHIFGTGGPDGFAVDREIDLLGRIPIDQSIRKACDNGHRGEERFSEKTNSSFIDLAKAIDEKLKNPDLI